ncbi:HutD/Ves family protein [Rathayibacter soli]|uniref:HutD/Ves family protein n=1 Tax=Rathayibacter soli TaxID=3144168 RepID=UPI0027E46632|nr:HutD family protein [Glaciibacter superstes]
MGTASVYRAADQVRMPWKNGAGTTLEVARLDDAATGRMLWRVSIADVADNGPFSIFDGYRRIISVLEGEGMQLTVGGERSRPLRRHDAFAFDGGAITNCELLGGPIRDFNLIFAADRVAGRMRWVTVRGRERIASTAATLLVYNAADETVHAESDTSAVSLDPGDCLRMGDAELSLLARGSSEAVCAVIELSAHKRPVVE